MQLQFSWQDVYSALAERCKSGHSAYGRGRRKSMFVELPVTSDVRNLSITTPCLVGVRVSRRHVNSVTTQFKT